MLLDGDGPTTNFLDQLLLKSMAVAGRCLVAKNGAQALALFDSARATLGPGGKPAKAEIEHGGESPAPRRWPERGCTLPVGFAVQS